MYAMVLEFPRTVRTGIVLCALALACEGAWASEEYLIITREMFLDTLAPLVLAREAEGLDVHVTTLSEIQSLYPGLDVQEQVRACVTSRYREHNAVWVLLVGCPDADDNPAATDTLDPTVVDKPWELPVRYVYAPTDDYVYVPAEAYYSCLDGTWDADGDGIYGEKPRDCEVGIDEVDWLAEVNLGRIPAQAVQQVADYVDKLLTTDYSALGLEDLHVLQLNCALDDVLCDLPVPGLVLANAPGYDPPTGARVDAELNSGQYPLLTHTGHGSTQSWSFSNGGWSGSGLGTGNNLDVEQAISDRYEIVGAWQSLAQTFKPQSSTLSAAKVFVWRVSAPPVGPLVISIRASLEGPDLTSGMIDPNEITRGYGFYEVTFDPIDVIAGQEYTLVITSPETTTAGHYWSIGSSEDDRYADGIAYKYSNWDPGWKPQACDLAFATISHDPNDPGPQEPGRPFFAYASACLTAYLDRSNDETTIAENLLFRPRLGALGYVGAWRLSTPVGQNDLWRDFWRAFFDNGMAQPSRALSAAQRSYYFCYAYWHHNWYNYYRYTQLIYSYLGDPYLQIGTVPANGPTVVSVPATSVQYETPYWYDDDCQADAIGSGPITWEKVSGPEYFHISVSGVVDWIPEHGESDNNGRPTIVVRASDDNGSTYHRWVVQCGGALRITSTPMLQAHPGQAYHYDDDDTAQAVGPSYQSPLCWKKIAGPLDLDIHPETGRITWTPGEPGDYEVILGVFQSYYCDFQRFVINVAD